MAQVEVAILNPTKRLCCELSYPIDSRPEDVDALFAALSRESSERDLLIFSEQLEPLSRANFIAHVAAHQPANGALLTALVELHALIDPTRIYEILKATRRTAGCAAPSLVNVNQGLRDLRDVHVEAAIAKYGTIEDAAEPMLACTEQILALGEDYTVEVLYSVLAVYRRYVDRQQQIAAEKIEPGLRSASTESCRRLFVVRTDEGPVGLGVAVPPIDIAGYALWSGRKRIRTPVRTRKRPYR